MKALLITFVIALLIPVSAQAEVPNVDGVWAQLQVQTALTDIPILGKLKSETISLLRVQVEQTGTQLKLQSTLCEIQIEAPTSKIQTLIPKALVRAIGTFRMRAELREAAGEWSFYQGPTVAVLGAKLKNSWDDPLPTDPEDPLVIDADKDGKPGVTVKVVGLVKGSIYLVQRGWTELKGKIAANSIRGKIRWNNTQEILGSSSMLLNVNPSARPDLSASHFRMIKIPAATTCADLVKRKPQLFK